MQETPVRFWVGKIPWRRERPPIPVFWAEEFHELYNPCSHKESDTTEQFSLSLIITTTTKKSIFCRVGFNLFFFLEVPGSRFFCPCGPYSLCHNSPTLPLWCKISHRKYVNECMWLKSNKTLLTKLRNRLL